MVIFDFQADSDIRNWQVVDDDVMGGRSNGRFYLNKEGFGVFEGAISLENNGGFSSVRYRFNPKNINEYEKIVLRLKGDGKAYQFRLKANQNEPYSYIYSFNTSGKQETIEIRLSAMYPSFRGRKLELPNFNGERIQEIAFLIGNRKAENFRLEISNIKLE
ncbi:MAG: CIA30 family protein [Flavobacteriaceae bacterium]|nr:CIA30 family protein [Flavobacteriaceae bacterium]